MEALPNSVVALLSQIPLAGIVVVTVWLFLSYIAKKDKASQDAMAQQYATQRDFLMSISAANVTAIDENRKAIERSIDSMCEGITELTQAVAANNQLIASHDRNTLEGILNVERIYEKINNTK